MSSGRSPRAWAVPSSRSARSLGPSQQRPSQPTAPADAQAEVPRQRGRLQEVLVGGCAGGARREPLAYRRGPRPRTDVPSPTDQAVQGANPTAQEEVTDATGARTRRAPATLTKRFT